MLYKYGLRSRGVSIGTQPSDFIKYEDVDKKTTEYWSFVYYDRELSQEELNKYEMDLIQKLEK